jgi:hypothetical protein
MRLPNPLLLAATCALIGSAAASAQVLTPDEAAEQAIRTLEQEQVDALLLGDLERLASRWADGYTVNNPRNAVGRAADGPVRAGTRTYASFVREVERVLVHGETAIAMGSETVVPSGPAPDAGETIRRRFTDVWMRTEGRWLLTARHANVVCPD